MKQDSISDKSSDKNLLIESEQKYKTLIEILQDAILIYQNGKIIYLNPAGVKLFGAKRPEEIIGKSALDFFHPQSHELIKTRIKKILETGQSVPVVEEKIVQLNGNIIDVEVTSTPFKMQGETAIQVVLKNMSERIKAEQKIKTSEKKYENLFHSIPDAIMVANAQRIITHYNPAFANLFGYRADEILGNQTSYLTADIDEFNKMGIKIKENIGKQSFLTTIQYKKKNSEVFPGETNLFYLKNDNDEIEGFIAMIRDITEREKARLALQLSEERWQFALEGSGDGIWDWDLKTDKVFFSKQWKTMLGYRTKEITNNLEEWKARVHPDDLEQALKDINKHLNGKTEIYKNEHRLLCKDGTYKWILDRGKVLTRDAEKRPLRMIGIHTDINERKLAEFELKTIQFGMENAQIGIYQVEEDATISYANQYALEIIGYSRKELTGMSMFKIAPYLKSKHFNGHRKKSQKKRDDTIISVHKRKDGTEFPIEITTSYFTFGKKSLSFSFVTDITERIKSENKLKELKNNLQIEVEEKTKELAERVTELERFQEATIEREFRMKELRDEIERLKNRV